ncbi:hypothetical protein [Pararhizobium gei]|uniref:hypothetical protein n=1 Tax=Pararhizobium gei TaxID=1395951 RepID=UPI0023DB95E4|nr:hypothetical protein [Rhizobium gei]
MRKPITLIATLGFVTALSGCNSMDDLTPQVDVGGGTFRSPPVNQADLDSMSQQSAEVLPQTTQPVTGTRLAPPAQESFAAGPSGTDMVQGDTEYTDPAGSLEAQAGRLREGELPRQQETVRSEAIAETAEAAPVEEPAERVEAQTEPTPQVEAKTSEIREPETSAAVAPAAAAGTIRFLPIIGAPVEAVQPLSKQLGAEARTHGLTIKGASDRTSEHILKGYFSALKDGRNTTIVYVWDVLDGAGNRLHRIQGQNTVNATAPDLWTVVPPETMRAIAARTIGEYLSWRASKQG